MFIIVFHYSCMCCSASDEIFTGHSLVAVIIDRNLTFDRHVSAVCRNAVFHLQALWQFRASLTQEMATSIAVIVIQSRLNYATLFSMKYPLIASPNYSAFKTQLLILFLRGVYSDTTQLDVKLSCVAINTPLIFVAELILIDGVSSY